MKTALVVIALVLMGLSALAAVPSRYVALEFAEFSVRPLSADFRSAKDCRAFIEVRRREVNHQRRVPGGRHYGCDSVSEMQSYLRRVFGTTVADAFR